MEELKNRLVLKALSDLPCGPRCFGPEPQGFVIVVGQERSFPLKTYSGVGDADGVLKTKSPLNVDMGLNAGAW